MTNGCQVFPTRIPNWVRGQELFAAAGELFEKRAPHDDQFVCNVARSRRDDIDVAIVAARGAQPSWAEISAVGRGDILYNICAELNERKKDVARVVALETGKSFKEALAETGGAIALGRFFAGEGQRLYGRTTTSATPNKYAMTVRQPCGVAGLIIAANTPIANLAWKVFPALICGNAAVVKAAEDTPVTAWIFGRIAHAAGLPAGVLNIVQGFGEEAGAALVKHPEVDVLSFTGSSAVGRWIAKVAGRRLAKVSLELGGKNPLIVCDDADLDNAAKWVCLSAFSNAGQRCAASSRIIIFDAVYDSFRERLIAATQRLKVGPADDDDLGPVLNKKQLEDMTEAIKRAETGGARILIGGKRLTGPNHINGYYMPPTLIETDNPNDEISTRELFGPIATLYRVDDFRKALTFANDSPYGLTACIHTRNFDRAIEFVHKIQAGVAVVNAGTYGSEPHMPFGGLKQSGNGTREPGTEALDVYSELKDVYMLVDPAKL